MAEPVQAEQARLKAAQPHRVGRPKETVVTGFLIFDDSVHTKPKGRAMGGLGRHYSATEKKDVSGHGLLSGLYVLLDQRCPLEPRMYCQKRVCEAEGVPFQSKYAHLVPTWVRKLGRTSQVRAVLGLHGAGVETYFEYGRISWAVISTR